MDNTNIPEESRTSQTQTPKTASDDNQETKPRQKNISFLIGFIGGAIAFFTLASITFIRAITSTSPSAQAIWIVFTLPLCFVSAAIAGLIIGIIYSIIDKCGKNNNSETSKHNLFFYVIAMLLAPVAAYFILQMITGILAK